MGTVYRATDRQLGRDVAIKVVNSHMLGKPSMRERFRREVEALAGLCHPNVVRLYDYEELPDGNVFYTMELVDGETLSQRMDDKPLSIDKATEYLEQVTAAIVAVHELGIIHRDIKGDNVLITRHGMAKVTDFGLAAGAQSGVFERLTKTGQIVGTALYIAPEIMWGDKASERSDVYQLGILLYQALTGICPINMLMLHSFVKRELPEEIPRVGNIRKGVDSELEAIVAKAMAFEPEARYERASDLARDLRKWRLKFLASQSVVVAVTKRQSRHWLPAALFTLLFLFYLAYRFYPSDELVFRDFFVKAKSCNACLVKWVANVEPAAVLVKVTDMAGRDVDASFIAEEISAREGKIVIRGLLPETSYDVWLLSKGHSTVIRRFQTMARGQEKYERSFALPREKSGLVTLERPVPFRLLNVKNLGLDKKRESRLKQYRKKHQLLLPIADLAKKPLFFIDVVSLDGEEQRLTIDCRLLLAQAFQRSIKAFAKSIEDESVYRVLQTGSKRLNEIMRPPRKVEARAAHFKQMWDDVCYRLRKKTLWYEGLEANLPGLEDALRCGLVNEQNGLAITEALAPLSLINGAAGWCRVSLNERWMNLSEELLRSHAFVSTESHLRQVNRTFDFLPTKGPKLSVYLVMDWNHPRKQILVNQDVGKSTTGRRFHCTIPNRPFTGPEIVELKVNIRAPMLQALLRMKLNDGVCSFILPIPYCHWQTYRKERDLSDDYSDFMVMGLRYFKNDGSKLQTAAKDIEETLPKRPYPIYVRLPADVIRTGHNVLDVDILNGPIDDMVGLVFEGPVVQIGR